MILFCDWRNIPLQKRDVYSIIMALFPVICIYKVPILNIGLASLLVIALIPIPIISLLESESRKTFFLQKMFMAVFFGYYIFKSLDSTMNCALLVATLIHIVGFFHNTINSNLFKKNVEIVSFFCVIVIIFQYILYYIFSYRFYFLIPSLLVGGTEDWFVATRGLYRPAGIFLEPSHVSAYASVAVASLLFPTDYKRPDIKKALFISLGTLMTTSGMGIVLIASLFGWYIIFNNNTRGSKFFSIISWSFIALIVVAFLMQIPVFQQAFSRIYSSSDQYDSTGFGRFLYWKVYIEPLTGVDLIFGKGTANLPEDYFTGIMKLIYALGMVGCFMFYFLLFSFFFSKKNNLIKVLIFLFGGLMVVGDYTGFIRMLFYFSLIISLFVASSDLNRITILKRI